MLIFALTLSAVFAYLASSVESHDVPNTTIVLDYGSFIGTVNETSGIVNYRGIRYADPPVGILRWRAPVSPPTVYAGVVNASEYSPTCIPTKLSTTTIPDTMSEDCLFGNVYVPVGTNATSNLPVLVYFHGGGYQAGSARSAPPEWIMGSAKAPFIFVTFQYRLGQFGFLGGSAVSNDGVGNAGLLDQRAALRWVQRYILYFGGDKSRVSIWGQSAGAGSTMFHLIANGGDNEGLFAQAMGDSAALGSMPLYDAPILNDLFNRFATLVGCDVLSPYVDVMPCLRAANSSTLAAAGNLSLQNYQSILFPFQPSIDGIFIQEAPVQAFRNGRFAKVPVFFGSNTNEGANWASGLPDPIANTRRAGSTQYSVYNFLRGQYANLTAPSFMQAVEQYPLAQYNDSFDLQGQQMYGEMRFICTAGLIAGSVQAAGLDAYQYHYDNPHLGSFHHYELQAMFATEATDFPQDASDMSLFESMRQYWTSFALEGKPSADDAPEWTTAKNEYGGPRMLLNPTDIGMEDVAEDLSTRCDFWHDINGQLST
ncbi:alpha/beta-hydrolase [Hymenopellis radicata]|nr:alpha/beta-hydrolase [Hymenopellis radicata]